VSLRALRSVFDEPAGVLQTPLNVGDIHHFSGIALQIDRDYFRFGS